MLSAYCLTASALIAAATAGYTITHTDDSRQIVTVTAPARQPIPANIADLKRGQRVQVTGHIIRIIDRDEFRLADDTASIPVHIPWDGPQFLEAGNRVTVEGTVDDNLSFGLPRPELYATTLRLHNGTTILFAPPETNTTTSSNNNNSNNNAATHNHITPIASLARGQSATITGRVARILDTDEFRLEDPSGSVRVYIGWRNALTVAVGDQVTVSGTLDDDPWPIRPEFYASSITYDGGRNINLTQQPTPADPQATDPAQPTITTNRPQATTPIANLNPYDIVRVVGTVERITDEDEFRLRDDSGSVTVYIGWRNRMPVNPGETATVIGIVDTKGPAAMLREIYAYEITTANGNTIQLQPNRINQTPTTTPTPTPTPTQPQPAADPNANPSAIITTIASVRRGQTVALRGTVERIRDSDEFILRDDSGAIDIYIGWKNRMPVAVGQLVTVFGTADDDVFPGRRPDIYADRITLPDGQTITLQRGGYDD